MIRLVLADDEDLVRGALAALLELEDDIAVVAQASDGAAAVRLVRGYRPDVVVLDLEMPGMDGLLAAATIRAETETPIVIVTRHARPGVLKRALAQGVRGFVSKITPAAKLASIIRDVHAGGRYIDAEVAASALTANSCPLSNRELELLAHTMTGGTIASIAAASHLAPGTVRNYLSSAMTKLGASTRHEAARRAWEEGWI